MIVDTYKALLKLADEIRLHHSEIDINITEFLKQHGLDIHFDSRIHSLVFPEHMKNKFDKTYDFIYFSDLIPVDQMIVMDKTVGGFKVMSNYTRQVE